MASEDRVRGAPRLVCPADDLVTIVDRVGTAVLTAERAEIDQRPLSPRKGVERQSLRRLHGHVAVSHDGSTAVDRPGVALPPAERPEVDHRRGPPQKCVLPLLLWARAAPADDRTSVVDGEGTRVQPAEGRKHRRPVGAPDVWADDDDAGRVDRRGIVGVHSPRSPRKRRDPSTLPNDIPPVLPSTAVDPPDNLSALVEREHGRRPVGRPGKLDEPAVLPQERTPATERRQALADHLPSIVDCERAAPRTAERPEVRICPFSQTTACQAPDDVSAVPAISPFSLTSTATLPGPPSVPRSRIRPFSDRNAWSSPSPSSWPTICPRSLIASALLSPPRSVPRSTIDSGAGPRGWSNRGARRRVRHGGEDSDNRDTAGRRRTPP